MIPRRGGRTLPLFLLSATAALAACIDRPAVPTEPEIPAVGALGHAGQDRVRVIIRLAGRGDQAAMAHAATAQGARVLHQYRNFPLLAIEVSRNALPGLLRSRRFVSVEEDVGMQPHMGSSLPVIRADALHDLGIDGTGYAIAVLDAGIDRDHPFVAGRVVEEACYSTPGEGDTSLCPDGDNGPGTASLDFDECKDGAINLCNHGMYTTGIAAGAAGLDPPAPPAGVAPGADIISSGCSRA
jgi:subtilisin family serine protease